MISMTLFKKILDKEIPHPIQLGIDKLQFIHDKLLDQARNHPGDDAMGALLIIEMLAAAGTLYQGLLASALATLGPPGGKAKEQFLEEIFDCHKQDILKLIGGARQ